MLIHYLQHLAFADLVDMGCGSGEFLLECVRLRPGAHFIGVDCDELAIYEAKQRWQKYATDVSRETFLHEDCTHTSLPKNSVDVVVFRKVLHHIEIIADALREAHRILRIGGFLFIEDGKRLPDSLFREMNEQLGARSLAGEVHPGFDIAELSKELDAQGFVVEHLSDAGEAIFATPPYTKRVYSTEAFLLVAKKVAE